MSGGRHPFLSTDTTIRERPMTHTDTNPVAPAATFTRAYHPHLADYLSKRIRIAPNGCWEWQRSCTAGYGSTGPSRLARQHGTQYAHRLAFLCAMGELPPDPYVIRHHCDNRLCCRPDHLAGGTHSENRMDAVERNRGGGARPGETHHMAKLTEADVRSIRISSGSNAELANRYGVCTATISNARSGRSWRHL